MNLGRTQTALGAYRRLAFRVGKAKAITGTARKLAILVYRTLKDGFVYADPGAKAYDAQHRTDVVRLVKSSPSSLFRHPSLDPIIRQPQSHGPSRATSAMTAPVTAP
jgi:hypothetical protein